MPSFLRFDGVVFPDPVSQNMQLPFREEGDFWQKKAGRLLERIGK